MPLRIAINLLHSPPQLTGTGRYAREMVRALAALPERPHLIGIVSPANHDAFRLDPLPSNLKLVRWGRPWKDVMVRRLEEWLWLEGFVRGLKPDVFWGPTNFLPLMAWRRPCPSVVTIHDMTFFRHPESIGKTRGWYWRAWTRRTLKVANKVITVSAAAAREIEEFGGVDAHSIPIVPNGVDDRFFDVSKYSAAAARLRARLPYLPNDFVLFVGTLTHHKNLPKLIEALATMRTRPGCEDALLVMAGKRGEGYDHIARAIHRSGMEKAVMELGFVEDDFLPALYASARLTVLPSLNEGFGLPIIEAMAAGCPVVTSDKGAMAEVSGGAAVLADVTSVESLAATLAELWVHPEICSDYGQRGLARARQFTWEASARTLYTLFEEVAKRP
jgi:glycosyltransferase involved in cell wall biosynthesis